jgi:hypothetical protein
MTKVMFSSEHPLWLAELASGEKQLTTGFYRD